LCSPAVAARRIHGRRLGATRRQSGSGRGPAYRASCETLGTDTVGAAVVGAGSSVGMVTTVMSGGPCPKPSCAMAAVMAVDATARNVTIAYFTVALRQWQQGAAVAELVGDPSPTSPDVGSIKDAPHQLSVADDRPVSLWQRRIKNRSREPEIRGPSGTGRNRAGRNSRAPAWDGPTTAPAEPVEDGRRQL
jgi:hypothetical protein